MATLRDFTGRGYFQKPYGYHCVDEGWVPGELGNAVGEKMLLLLRKDHLYPTHAQIDHYSEDDLFDVIEFEFDHVAKPISGRHHTYSDCGWHYNVFDDAGGRVEFREAINLLLRDYSQGYELSSDGEIFELPTEGMERLTKAQLPLSTNKSVADRVAAAQLQFFRYGSTIDDRRKAVRDLADVLEFVREDAKAVLTKKDESELFNIINNFGIRHHNDKQKMEYDPAVWLSWMYYFFLATIHAVVRLTEKARAKT